MDRVIHAIYCLQTVQIVIPPSVLAANLPTILLIIRVIYLVALIVKSAKMEIAFPAIKDFIC